MPATQAIVVGAGIAGLTAAYRLQQAGWRCMCWKQHPTWGGA